MLINTVINAASELFTTLEEKEEQAAQKAQAVTSSFNELKNSYAEGSNKIGELSARYNELSGGVSAMGENISLTDDEYTEYKNTISELSGLMPNLNMLFNEQGEKIGFVGGKLKDASEQYQKYMQTQAQTILRNGDEDGNKFQDTLDDFKYSSETNTYGWSNGWRDYVGSMLKGLTPHLAFGEMLFNGGNHSDWGSELFGATQEYSTQEQLDMLQQLTNTGKENWSDILKDVSTGDSKEANLVEELLGIDVDKVSEMSEDEYSQLQKVLAQKIAGLQQELEGKAKQVTSGMQNMLLADDDYWQIEDGNARNALSSMFSGLNYDALTGLNIDLDDQLSIETWVAGFVDDINANKDGVTDAILGLFQLDVDALSPSEAKELTDKYITTIANTMYDGSATVEQKDSLKESLGFDKVDRNYSQFQNTLKDFNETKTENIPHQDSHKNLHTEEPKVYDSNRTKELTNWADSSKVTQKELEQLKEKGYGAKTSIEELHLALNELRKKELQKTKNPATFGEAWNSIDTTGTDEQKSDKQKLLELAEAGKLTEEALKNTSLASIFEEAGVSIEEATRKVNAFADETKQLSAMKTGINAITSAYDEKSSSSQNTVSSSTLESLGDTLGTEDWNGSDKKVWENYKSVAGDNTKTLKELKAAQDELAASYVNSNNFLANIEDGSYQYYVSLLKEMGVTNAAAVATEALNRKKADAKLTNFNLAEASNEEIASFGNYITSLQGANGALGDYIIKKQLAAGADLETSGSIQNLINLATQSKKASKAVSSYYDY